MHPSGLARVCVSAASLFFACYLLSCNQSIFSSVPSDMRVDAADRLSLSLFLSLSLSLSLILKMAVWRVDAADRHRPGPGPGILHPRDRRPGAHDAHSHAHAPASTHTHKSSPWERRGCLRTQRKGCVRTQRRGRVRACVSAQRALVPLRVRPPPPQTPVHWLVACLFGLVVVS